MRPPGTGAAQTGVGMTTNVEISARPVTQQGMSGMKTAAAGPGRQVADKSFFLNTLRVKIQDISSEMEKLQAEIDQKQREGNEFAHLQKRFESARRKGAERQTTLADYNFAKEKMNMDMDEIVAAAKELKDVCDFRRKQVDEVFKERKSKEYEIKQLDTEMTDLRAQALSRLESMGKDKVEVYRRLDSENREALTAIEQQRRQLTDLTLTVNAKEDELKQDPLRKKGTQLTTEKKMYEEQLRDLNEQDDDESLPFDEAKKRLLKKIKDDNETIQDMENQKVSISNQIKEMKEKVQQVEANLAASAGGRSEKHKELQQKDQEMTKYLDAYPEEKRKNVDSVLRSEKNIVSLLKHISSEINRKQNLPSAQDVGSMKSDLAFKQNQFENAEATLQRISLELNERKQDLERVEELERKMNQEMDNLNQKMEEMRDEIKIFEDIDALKTRAEHEKKIYKSKRALLKKRRDTWKHQLKIQSEEAEQRKKKNDINQDKSNELDNLEKKVRAMEDNLFVMKEFVSEKGAETNVAPLRDEVRNLGHELNQMLIDAIQRAA